MKIRTYERGDLEEVIKLFYETVHEVNIKDYAQEQVDAWAPANIDVELWIRRLSSKLIYLAEEGDKIIGFGVLEENGHIDCFYCHKDFQRQGVGRQILSQIESKARSLGLARLFTEASITAKLFFESQGFIVVRQQEVELRGQSFINFFMVKTF